MLAHRLRSALRAFFSEGSRSSSSSSSLPSMSEPENSAPPSRSLLSGGCKTRPFHTPLSAKQSVEKLLDAKLHDEKLLLRTCLMTRHTIGLGTDKTIWTTTHHRCRRPTPCRRCPTLCPAGRLRSRPAGHPGRRRRPSRCPTARWRPGGCRRHPRPSCRPPRCDLQV